MITITEETLRQQIADEKARAEGAILRARKHETWAREERAKVRTAEREVVRLTAKLHALARKPA